MPPPGIRLCPQFSRLSSRLAAVVFAPRSRTHFSRGCGFSYIHVSALSGALSYDFC
jgi:hypothetical protein